MFTTYTVLVPPDLFLSQGAARTHWAEGWGFRRDFDFATLFHIALEMWQD